MFLSTWASVRSRIQSSSPHSPLMDPRWRFRADSIGIESSMRPVIRRWSLAGVEPDRSAWRRWKPSTVISQKRIPPICWPGVRAKCIRLKTLFYALANSRREVEKGLTPRNHSTLLQKPTLPSPLRNGLPVAAIKRVRMVAADVRRRTNIRSASLRRRLRGASSTTDWRGIDRDLFMFRADTQVALVGHGEVVHQRALLRQVSANGIAVHFRGDRLPASFLPFTCIGCVVQPSLFQRHTRHDMRSRFIGVEFHRTKTRQRRLAAQNTVSEPIDLLESPDVTMRKIQNDADMTEPPLNEPIRRTDAVERIGEIIRAVQKKDGAAHATEISRGIELAQPAFSG